MSITPTNRPGWFVADRATATPLSGVPGLEMLNPERWRLHRTHLPLLVDNADAARILLPVIKPDWAARDALTEPLGFKLRNVQQSAIDYLTQRRGAILGDDMRCIAGDAILQCNRAGKSFKITLADLHFKFNGGQTRGRAWDQSTPTTVRALCGDEFRLHKIKAVHAAGRRAVLLLKTKGGKQLRLTPDHEVMLQNGSWVRADALAPGQSILVNGKPVCVLCGSTEGVITYAYAKFRGHCLTCMYRVKRAKPTWIGGKFINGDGYVMVSGQHHHPRHRKGTVKEHHLVMEAVLGRYLVEGEIVHHKNEDKTDNRAENLELTTSSAHAVQHGRAGGFRRMHGGISAKGGEVVFIPKPDVVESIAPDGFADVFDLVCDDPHRNFVANGIVVHNCGKTLAAIMSHDPASGPFAVICPTMVRPVWIGWLKRVFPDEPIGVFEGRTFNPETLKHKIIVGHYDILPWWQSTLPIGTLVFDEAHVLTNRKARRSNAALFLSAQAKRVIAATGTPIWNMPPNLWSILGLIAPGAWGGYHEFSRRYGLPVTSAHGTKYTGISNENELQMRLSEVMIRRRWVDVADDLPPITRSVALVELDTETSNKLDILAAQIRSDKATTIGNLSRYREQLSRIKAPVVLQQTADMLDRGEPVVVWTWHVALAEKIAKTLGDRAFLLTGDVTSTKRDEAIAAWKAHPAAALVCTMAVAQVGLDFSHAHLAIFAEIDYTPAILAQAEMRTYAPSRPMNITFVIADHVVDQRIVLALIRKLGAANPLGVGAANDAIEALQFALHGPAEEPDLDRLLEDLLR